MVACKFFQQGYCRYGQNCRFEHIYGSKYNYQSSNVSAPSQSGCTDEQLVNQVQSDIQSALKGGQWILSAYAPFKEKPNFPGISDLSPEEARLFIYEAKANNTIDQAVAFMNNLFKEGKYKYEQLLQPSPSITKILRSIYKSEVVSSPFSNATQMHNAFGSTNANTASSIFHNAIQDASAFGQSNTNNSVFGQTAPVFGTQNSNNSMAKSIFAQATQNMFGLNQTSNNVFGTSNTDNARSIFAQANQNVFGTNQQSTALASSQNVFGVTAMQQSNSPFTAQPTPFGNAQSSPFGNAQSSGFGNTHSTQFANVQRSPFASPQSSTNVFQRQEHPANVFGVAAKSVLEKNVGDDNGVYSKLEELSEEDLEAFRSEDFKLCFVPEVPPPRSLCI